MHLIYSTSRRCRQFLRTTACACAVTLPHRYTIREYRPSVSAAPSRLRAWQRRRTKPDGAAPAHAAHRDRSLKDAGALILPNERFSTREDRRRAAAPAPRGA